MQQPGLFTAGVSTYNATLFLGAAIAITAFPVLARIIHDRGLDGTAIATQALSAAAIGDAVAWCVVAVVLASLGAGHGIVVLAVAGGLALALVLIFLGPKLFAPLGRMAEAQHEAGQPLSPTVLAIALTIAYRSTTAVERRKYLFAVLKQIDLLWLRIQGWWRELEPFRSALRERTRIAPVTPLIAILNVAIFIGIVFHPHLLDDPDPLVSWGASFGPRTANGEWWRLITTLFVHVIVVDLLVNLLALVPLGLLLERIVGPLAFGAVYLTSGLFASLFSLSVYPIAVSVGPAGAVAGVYAFMLAVSLWGSSQRPRLIQPARQCQLIQPPRNLRHHAARRIRSTITTH